MTGTTEPQKSGLPGWLKIVLIVGVVFIIGSIGLFVGCSMLLNNIQDPQHIKQIASTFMTINEPPGGGFDFVLGLDMGAKVVGLENKQKNLKIVIATFGDAKDLDDPEKALNKMSSVTGSSHSGTSGSSHSDTSASSDTHSAGTQKRFEATSKGTEKVGGRDMNYAVGFELKKDGSKEPTFIGLFPPGPKGSVIIFGQSQGDKYDLDTTNELLKSISAI